MLSTKAADVIDLESIVRKWAKQMFDTTKTKEQSRIPKDHLKFTIHWNRVRFVHHEPDFVEQKKPTHPKSHVLFKTHFTNSTDSVQEYSFKTERTTSSVCEVYVERAVTLGFEMNLSLKTPCEIFEANAGFKRELAVTNAQGQVIEESLTWGVDSVIKVPSMYKTSAELVIFEDEFEGAFSIRTDFSGKVVVAVTNVRDNNCWVKTLEGDIDEIIRNEVENNNGVKAGFTRQDRIVSFTTNGRCRFRYGIEQHVKLSQEKI